MIAAVNDGSMIIKICLCIVFEECGQCHNVKSRIAQAEWSAITKGRIVFGFIPSIIKSITKFHDSKEITATTFYFVMLYANWTEPDF